MDAEIEKDWFLYVQEKGKDAEPRPATPDEIVRLHEIMSSRGGVYRALKVDLKP